MGWEAWIRGARSSSRPYLPLSTGQDTCSRLFDSEPNTRLDEPIMGRHPMTSRPVALPTRAAPFLTCRSLRTKFAARPTRMGFTRLGRLPPRPAAPYGPGPRPREHRPERGDGYHLYQAVGHTTPLKEFPPHGMSDARTPGHPD